ncbi:MAG: murein L,D-transpeptidase catalytic domain family protein [Bacteroidales bacterium]|nr:murein L,D-transpeptidase catalytic domain family protein [Bacteroidales bacterium]MBN2817743.1 murein L,D-transpeptidase catalytic domain family protein [Bacteroidales bacterium]
MTRKVLLALLILVSILFIKGKGKTEYTASLVNDVEKARTLLNSYKSLLVENNINTEAFEFAYAGFLTLQGWGELKNDSLLTIVDYSKPSVEDRFIILDIKNRKLIYKSLVAHGQNSGLNIAEDFSNKQQSHKSSLGLYLTSNTYSGKHGYSLRLKGLEEGINNNAWKRAIVVHGAEYVSHEFIQKNGRLGRSFGCPALPTKATEQIINLIKEGTCLYIYHPSIKTIYFASH